MAVSATVTEGWFSPGVRIITFTLSGSDDTAAVASASIDTPGDLLGCFVDPTTGTAPDAAWDFTIEDDNYAGFDLMSGEGADQSATAQVWLPVLNAHPVPVSGKVGINVTNFGASTSRDAVVRAIVRARGY